MFAVADKPLDVEALKAGLLQEACGACVTFEGWVRNHNHGKSVVRLEYEVHRDLAIREGDKVIDEALKRFPIELAQCVHREGPLDISECSVWVGVSAHHRDAAFNACRYIIDEIKQRLPIWKKEFYEDGDSGWVNCEGCSASRSAAVSSS